MTAEKLTTRQRLSRYYDFDSDIVANVAEAATRQNRYSFTELAQQFDIEDGSLAVVPKGFYKPIEVLKIVPTVEYDDSEALVYHTAYGYPVNNFTAMHALRIHEAKPDKQLFVYGNPAFIGMPTGKLSLKQSLQVVRRNTLVPTVEPILAHLHEQGIVRTSHLGYSYSADKAAVAISNSSQYGQEVEAGVLVEPVSIDNQKLLQLFKKFASSGAPQDTYIRQTDSKPYVDLWDKNSYLGFAGWAGGLARLSNLAVANVMANGRFEERADAALADQSCLKLSIGWGMASELVVAQAAERVVTNLANRHGPDRVSALVMRGMHHAAVDDIDLHAAVMLQGLQNSTA